MRKIERNLEIFRAVLEGASIRGLAREHAITHERIRMIFEATCKLVAGPETYARLGERPYQAGSRRLYKNWWLAKADMYVLEQKKTDGAGSSADVPGMREKIVRVSSGSP